MPGTWVDTAYSDHDYESNFCSQHLHNDWQGTNHEIALQHALGLVPDTNCLLQALCTQPSNSP